MSSRLYQTLVLELDCLGGGVLWVPDIEVPHESLGLEYRGGRRLGLVTDFKSICSPGHSMSPPSVGVSVHAMVFEHS